MARMTTLGKAVEDYLALRRVLGFAQAEDAAACLRPLPGGTRGFPHHGASGHALGAAIVHRPGSLGHSSEPGHAVITLPVRENFVGDPRRPALHGGVVYMMKGFALQGVGAPTEGPPPIIDFDLKRVQTTNLISFEQDETVRRLDSLDLWPTCVAGNSQ